MRIHCSKPKIFITTRAYPPKKIFFRDLEAVQLFLSRPPLLFTSYKPRFDPELRIRRWLSDVRNEISATASLFIKAGSKISSGGCVFLTHVPPRSHPVHRLTQSITGAGITLVVRARYS